MVHTARRRPVDNVGVGATVDPVSFALPCVGDVARKVGTTVNDRSINLQLFEEVEDSLLDLYSGTRNLYLQRRERAIKE
jgi:ABC-type transporter lipoprotein component MlaA